MFATLENFDYFQRKMLRYRNQRGTLVLWIMIKTILILTLQSY